MWASMRVPSWLLRELLVSLGVLCDPFRSFPLNIARVSVENLDPLTLRVETPCDDERYERVHGRA